MRNKVGLLGQMYYQLNCYEWPRCLELFKPFMWDYIPHSLRHKHRTMKILWGIVWFSTTHRQRSRAWWLYKLQRTENDWKKWWGKSHAK